MTKGHLYEKASSSYSLHTFSSLSSWYQPTSVQSVIKRLVKKDVPATALKAFKIAFPNVKVKTYLTESEDGKIFYEFETVEGTIKRDILYTPEGTLVEVEEVLTTKTIPVEIAKAITADTPKAKIVGGEKTTKGSEVTLK